MFLIMSDVNTSTHSRMAMECKEALSPFYLKNRNKYRLYSRKKCYTSFFSDVNFHSEGLTKCNL